MTRSATTSPNSIKIESIESIVDTFEGIEDIYKAKERLAATSAPTPFNPDNDDLKTTIMDIIGLKQNGNKRKNENAPKAILDEVKRRKSLKNDSKCDKCQLTAEDMMLEIKQPASEAPAETATRLIKNIRKAKRR